MYLVAIGASAGGLEPINTLFDFTIENDAIAYVVVQHLSPDHDSIMDKLLQKHTSLKIKVVENEMEIQPNTIYLNSKDHTLHVENGRFLLDANLKGRTFNYPINQFFESAANDFGKNLIAVILSGTGTDGALGTNNVKEKEGFVIIQDPKDAQFDGMPLACHATGNVDLILKPEEIALYIQSLVNKSFDLKKNQQINLDLKTDKEVFEQILKEIFKVSGIDFTDYKVATIYRRIERRMAINQIDHLKGYLQFIYNNSEEVKIIAQSFLISVTEFFRDTEEFEMLKNEIVPELFKKARPGNDLRIWTPGCATGEEAYSIALLMEEYRVQNAPRVNFKIFATDIDNKALKKAANGIYTDTALNGLPENLKNNYFRQINNSYKLSNTIRDKVVFARHDLLCNPPFINMDMVVCRNLLIYFKQKAQERVLQTIHYALKEGAVLFLGTSENLGSISSSYQRIDEKHNFFVCLDKNRNKKLPVQLTKKPLEGVRIEQSEVSKIIQQSSNNDEFMDTLLALHTPPSVFIKSNFDILYINGQVEGFLKFPKKHISYNLMSMITPELEQVYISGVSQCLKEKKNIVYDNIQSSDNLSTSLIFRHIENNNYNESVILIEFHKKRKQQESSGTLFYENVEVKNYSNEYAKIVELQLKETKEELNSTINELEATNEELQASNEELLAANEEMQSTNEELQSVNEELYTVNAELQEKVKAILDISNDMSNILSSTELGTVFVDLSLNVRKFTPAISKFINLTETDIGRPIGHFTFNFDLKDINEILKGVIESGEKQEIEIKNHEGAYYLLRITPFRSSTFVSISAERNKITGAVLTFIDINELKLKEQEIKNQAALLQRHNNDLEQFAYVATHDLRSPLVNLEGLVDLFKEFDLVNDGNAEIFTKIDEQVKLLRDHLGDLVNIISSKENLKDSSIKIDLNNTTKEIINTINKQVKEAKAEISFDFNEVNEITYPTTHIHSILLNMLTNAIKYRDEKRKCKVMIKSYREDDFIRLEFRDNGIGIHEKHKDKIFKLFQKIKRNNVESKGIGLYLVKSQIETMGGKIEFESTIEKGTTFHVWLKDQN